MNFQSVEKPGSTAMTALAVEAQRAMMQVQGQIVSAKNFPRDIIRARRKILEECQRLGLAESSQYVYPRGKQKVTGPSIRLAEVLLRNWGNMEAGLKELSRGQHETLMEAYCMDFETNTRISRTFTQPHIRERAAEHGGNVELIDPRDIYEITANFGIRRMRACILEQIPADIIEDAIEQCNKTMAGESGIPLIDRIRNMVEAFEKLGVSGKMLEEHLRHPLDQTLEIELVNMRNIHSTLRDGEGKIEDFFKTTTTAPKASNGLVGKVAAGTAPPEPPAETPLKVERHRRTKVEMKAARAAEQAETPPATAPSEVTSPISIAPPAETPPATAPSSTKFSMLVRDCRELEEILGDVICDEIKQELFGKILGAAYMTYSQISAYVSELKQILAEKETEAQK